MDFFLSKQWTKQTKDARLENLSFVWLIKFCVTVESNRLSSRVLVISNYIPK